jgi:hypothetical protein
VETKVREQLCNFLLGRNEGSTPVMQLFIGWKRRFESSYATFYWVEMKVQHQLCNFLLGGNEVEQQLCNFLLGGNEVEQQLCNFLLGRNEG